MRASRIRAASGVHSGPRMQRIIYYSLSHTLMKRSRLTAILLPILSCGLVLCAQDAGMVLRTSVNYNTQRATLTLTDDQRSEAGRLARESQQANQAGKYGDALRSLYQGMAVMRSVPWTPAYEFASS